MKSLKIGLILFFLTFALPSSSEDEPGELVRVAIVTGADQIMLAIRGPYQILTRDTNKELARARHLWQARVISSENGIKISQDDFKVDGIRIKPKKSPAIYLNGRKFRGIVDIIRQPNKQLLAVNHLDIEDYVSGVLYHEVAPRWPIEALKAQAIASRTFALYQAKLNIQKEYDFVSTFYSQVYGGSTSERGRTTQAVRLTKGKALTYKNKLFPAFYHATCAGYTENASRLWNIDLPALKGRECQFCQRSPHFSWKAKSSIKEITEALEKAGLKIGAIKSIKIVDRDVSRRITDLEINSTAGKVKISAKCFRLALGPNLIKSTNFEFLKFKKGQLYFQGYGWGHGVGLCQWGTLFMARHGFNAEQILDYYYPESKIREIKETKDGDAKFKAFRF